MLETILILIIMWMHVNNNMKIKKAQRYIDSLLQRNAELEKFKHERDSIDFATMTPNEKQRRFPLTYTSMDYIIDTVKSTKQRSNWE